MPLAGLWNGLLGMALLLAYGAPPVVVWLYDGGTLRAGLVWLAVTIVGGVAIGMLTDTDGSGFGLLLGFALVFPICLTLIGVANILLRLTYRGLRAISSSTCRRHSSGGVDS